MQLQLDLVVAGLLDQALGHINDTLIQVRATGLGDGLDNVFCVNGTEELAGSGGLNLDLNVRQLLKLVADLACVVQVANFASFLGALDALNLLLSAAGSHDGQAAGKQVVTSVAVLNLNNFASGAEVLNGSGEDQLHDPCLSIELVE